MADPKIVDKKPCVVELEAGNYAWCSCGESKNQPYCDGSHAGTEFKPHIFKLEETKRVALCNCKYSKTGHLCDGTHSSL